MSYSVSVSASSVVKQELSVSNSNQRVIGDNIISYNFCGHAIRVKLNF